MNADVVINIGLVLLFVCIGGVFSGTEMAIVSLRESQVERIESEGKRGQRIAALVRNPNTFLSAVQIGVTLAGFFSSAYGASTLAPVLAPVLVSAGTPKMSAGTVMPRSGPDVPIVMERCYRHPAGRRRGALA